MTRGDTRPRRDFIVRQLLRQAYSLREQYADIRAEARAQALRSGPRIDLVDKARQVKRDFERVADELRNTYGRKVSPLTKEED